MLKSILDDLLNLVYPRTCAACGTTLLRHEEVICSPCVLHLPKTFYHKDQKNPLFELFWGKIPVEMVASYYFFNKGNKVQNLVHQLKYKGRPDIGVYLGQRYGAYLRNAETFSTIDTIIPVPLHDAKKIIRGYNQAEMFAQGLSIAMKIPFDTTSFVRTAATETQTKKTKQERWENVKDKFKVVETNLLKDKHVLLVDDVLTTGATLEACAHSLLEVPGLKISIATIAAAHH